MSESAKTGSTLRGMNPPPKLESRPDPGAPAAQQESGSRPPSPGQNPATPKSLRAEEFYPDDFRDLPPELVELAKQGKPLPKPARAPLAGSHQRAEPVDPTPIEIPLQATEYAEARPLPPTTDHKTIETETIKVDPEADPRRATTQKNLRTLARSKAADAESDAPPMLSDAPPTEEAVDTEPTVVDGAPPHRSGTWKFAVVGVLLMGGLVAVLATSWSKSRAQPDSTEPETAPTQVATAQLTDPNATVKQPPTANTDPPKSPPLTTAAAPALTKMPTPPKTSAQQAGAQPRAAAKPKPVAPSVREKPSPTPSPLIPPTAASSPAKPVDGFPDKPVY